MLKLMLPLIPKSSKNEKFSIQKYFSKAKSIMCKQKGKKWKKIMDG